MSTSPFAKGVLVTGVIGCGGLILIGSLFIIGIMSTIGTAFSELDVHAMEKSTSHFRESWIAGNTCGKKVAVIDIKGIIATDLPYGDGTSSKIVTAIIDELHNRSDVAALVLDIDSPGGEVTASDEIYHAIKEYKDETGVPVVAYFGPLAASGGYYIACAADSIVTHRTAITGSIGVIMSSISYYGLMEKIGVGANAITSGKMKDALSGARPTRPEELTFFQGVVDTIYSEFVRVVSEGRGIPEDAIRQAEFGDGRVVLGMDAVRLGLADQTGYFNDALGLAAELGDLPDNYGIFRLEERPGLLHLLLNASTEKRNINLRLPGADLPGTTLTPGKCYYLLPNYAH